MAHVSDVFGDTAFTIDELTALTSHAHVQRGHAGLGQLLLRTDAPPATVLGLRAIHCVLAFVTFSDKISMARAEGLEFKKLPGGYKSIVADNAMKMSDDDSAANLEVISGMSYLYFEFPGDNVRDKATGRQKRQYDSYICYGPPASKGKGKGGKGKGEPQPGQIRMDFPREVICDTLDLDRELADWRNCQKDGGTEKELTLKLREKFKAFIPKL